MFQRGPISGRGRRPVLATSTDGVPVRRGSRCRRGEERPRRGPAHVSCAWDDGRCGPRLYVSYSAEGMRRDNFGAAKAWFWLVVALPGLVQRHRGRQTLAGRPVRSMSGCSFPEQGETCQRNGEIRNSLDVPGCADMKRSHHHDPFWRFKHVRAERIEGHRGLPREQRSIGPLAEARHRCPD